MFVFAQFVPALLVPAVVARVEVSSRRGGLSTLYVVEAASIAAVGAMFAFTFSLPALLILVMVDGSAALAASALVLAIAGRVGEEDMSDQGTTRVEGLGARRASARINTAFSMTVVLGPPAAGVVVATAGVPAALFIDVLSFIACAVLIRNLHPVAGDGASLSVRARLREAKEYLRTAPQLRRLLIIEFVALISFESIAPVEVVYAKATLNAGDSGYGFLMGAWGVGMLIGGLVFSRFAEKPLGPLLTGGTLAVGVAYLGMAASPTIYVACCAALVGGMGNGVQWASAISSVQRLSPASLHARLMGALQSMGALALAIGLALGGLVTAVATPRGALWVAGAGATATTIAFLRESGASPAGTRETAIPGVTSASQAVADADRGGAGANHVHQKAL